MHRLECQWSHDTPSKKKKHQKENDEIHTAVAVDSIGDHETFAPPWPHLPTARHGRPTKNMRSLPSKNNAQKSILGFNKFLRMTARLFLSISAYALMAGNLKAALASSSTASFILSFGKLESGRNLIWGGISVTFVVVSILALNVPLFSKHIDTSRHPLLVGILVLFHLHSLLDLSNFVQIILSRTNWKAKQYVTKENVLFPT